MKGAGMKQRRPLPALEQLGDYIRTYHPRYTLADVFVSDSKGYLGTIKPCRCCRPPFDGYCLGVLPGKEKEHYHTIYIGRSQVGPFGKGFGRGEYAFWRAVKAELAKGRKERG